MTEESMIERVAKAIREAAKSDAASSLCEEFGGWGYAEDFVLLARAAIEEMREPTNVMIYAATEKHCLESGAQDDAHELWQAMIDKALA